MKNFNFQSRLFVYQNLLGKYDLIDKYKFSKIKFNYIKKIEFSYTTFKLISKQLKFLLFSEFLFQQYFNNNKNFKEKFRITLRNYFFCFDFFLNSIFLNEKLIINYSNLSNNISLNLPSSSSVDFFLNGLKQNYNKVNFNLYFLNKNINSSKFLSYYFIPKSYS